MDGILLQEPSNLSDINSEDIYSIEVLKGAAATSLYGSRAGSGVINIITKRGPSQVGVTEISFRNEFGQSFMPRTIEPSKHHPFVVEADGSVNYSRFDDDLIADNPYPQLFENHELFFDPGNYFTNNLSMGSRSRETNYNISLNHTKQSGVLFGLEGYRRTSIRANIDHQISDALKLSFSNYYSQSTSDEPSRQYFGSPFFQLLMIPPAVDLTEPNEEDGSPYNWDASFAAGSNITNPLYEIDNIDNSVTTERYSGSLGLKLKLLPSLFVEGSYALDRRTSEGDYFIDKGYFAIAGLNDGLYNRSSRKRSYQTATGKLTFTKSMNDFNLTSQAAIIYEDDQARFFDVEAYDLRFAGIRSLSNSGNLNTGDPGAPSVNRTLRSSNDFQIRTLNYYLTGTIDWRDKFIFDGLVRVDGSSLFGPKNRWNTFFRTSLAYRLTQDIRIRNVDELKLRVSYGTAGNRPLFDFRFETLNSDGTKNTLGNQDLRSSLKTEVESGFDARIWDRVNLSFTYAHSITSDLFYNVPLAATAGGFQSQWVNIDSEIESNSFEVAVGADIVRRRDFTFSLDLTFDRLRQTVTKFDFPDFRDYIFITRAGEPLGAVYIWKFAKSEDDLFAHQREGKSFVVNHEGWLVEAEKLGTVEEEPILVEEEDGNRDFFQGIANPDFDLGLGLNANWKGLQLYLLFHWRQGGIIYNETKQFTFRDLRDGDIDQAGRPEDEKKPVGYYSAFYQINRPNNYFLEKGTYLKLRELALSYTFNTGNWGSVGKVIKGMKISVVGRNLFTVTNYSGYDPEVGYDDESFDANANPIAAFGYPNFRTISGALEIKF